MKITKESSKEEKRQECNLAQSHFTQKAIRLFLDQNSLFIDPTSRVLSIKATCCGKIDDASSFIFFFFIVKNDNCF